MTMKRRNLYLPEDLYRAAERAAAEQTIAEGRRVSLSEWVRQAMAKRLERERGWEPSGVAKP